MYFDAQSLGSRASSDSCCNCHFIFNKNGRFDSVADRHAYSNHHAFSGYYIHPNCYARFYSYASIG